MERLIFLYFFFMNKALIPVETTAGISFVFWSSSVYFTCGVYRPRIIIVSIFWPWAVSLFLHSIKLFV